MKLSIVTAVYNEPRVSKALDSILAQDLDHEVETIVIDGGSTDDTVEILEDYRSRVDILVSEPDDGIYDAMNKGIERATGDVIGLLNSDDRYQDDSVLADIAAEFNRSDIDGTYGDLVYVDSNNEIVRYWRSGAYSPQRFYFGWMPPHPTLYLRREVYESLDEYDLAYPIAADYEFMLRLCLTHGATLSYIPRVLVRMATGGESNQSVSNIIRANKEVMHAWEGSHSYWKYIVPFLKISRKPLQYLQAQLKTNVS